jgi:hypothetical protein
MLRCRMVGWIWEKERCHTEVGAPARQDYGSSVYGNMS